MNSITQDISSKQSVVKYSYKNGVTAAAIQYNLHRKTESGQVEKLIIEDFNVFSKNDAACL